MLHGMAFARSWWTSVRSWFADDAEFRAAMAPLQWHFLALLATYHLTLGPLLSLWDERAWLLGRDAPGFGLLRVVVLVTAALLLVAYAVHLRQRVMTTWKRVVVNGGIAFLLFAPALIGALNQRADGGVLAYVVTLFAVSIIAYVRPAVMAVWFATSLTLVVWAARTWQVDPGVAADVQHYTVRAAISAWVVYAVLDTFRRSAYRRQRQLAELNALKDTVLEALEHDLKTPLLHVRQVARVLEEGASVRPLDARELGRKLDAAVERTSLVTSNLVAIAGSGSHDEMAGLRDVLELQDVLESAAAFVEPEATAKRVHLRLTVEDADVLAVGSRETLVAVLRNLLDNAVKFSRAGGMVELRATTEAHDVCVSVRDEGIGMTDAVRNEVLAGRAVHGSHGTQGEVGTGIGLTVVRTLLTAMGASLDVGSREREGTTVSFRIPRYQRAGVHDGV